MVVGWWWLGGGLVVRTLMQPDGWAERFWQTPPELGRFVRRLVWVGVVAALVFRAAVVRGSSFLVALSSALPTPHGLSVS